MNNLKKLLSNQFFVYFFWGLCTTLLNLGIYRGLLLVNTKYWLANLIAMLLSRIFAYVTNKIFVFKSKTASPKSLLLEMLRFILARGFTGLIDIFGLIFLVEVIGMDEIISKYLLMGIIILLNFVLGKKLVFRSA